MPTDKLEVIVTFEETIADILATLAKKEKIPVSRLARELILEALELREDIALSAIADARDIENVKTVSHEDAWK
jgi:predicted xylose isomerase-like sugar epimerase